MILSKISFDSYNEIKHLTNTSKISLEHYLKMNQIYSEITGKPISKGCDHCILQAWLIINNWAEKFYEETLKAYQVEKPKRTRKKRNDTIS